jgi:hypothetical protein
MPLVRHDLTGHPEEDDLYGTAPAVGAALRFLYRSVTVSDPALPLAKHVIFADMDGNLVVSVAAHAAPERVNLYAATRMADIADRRPWPRSG